MKCQWCGEVTEHPFMALFSHFWLYQPGQWKYMRGNVRTFGLWDGFWGTIYLIFPFANSLRHWRHRKSRLEFK